MSKSQDDKHLCSPNEDFGWPDKHSMVPKRRFCKAEQTFGNVFSKNFFTYVSLSIKGRCCHYISAVFRSVRTSHMTRLCPKQHNTSTVLKIIHTSRVNGVRALLFETIFKGSRTIVMLSPWTHAPARLTTHTRLHFHTTDSLLFYGQKCYNLVILTRHLDVTSSCDFLLATMACSPKEDFGRPNEP